jgi:hypothetical protein
MLQFTYKLKITERVKGKCSRHPRYNPEKDGRAGIRGACSCCFSLYDLYQARMALDAAQREFIRRAAPWVHSRQPRRPKSATDAGQSGDVPLRSSRSMHQRLGSIGNSRFRHSMRVCDLLTLCFAS